MAKRMFSVTALWDDAAKVFYSESDIIGLHIEAPTIEQFEEVMMDVAPGLVISNHVSKAELASMAPKAFIMRPKPRARMKSGSTMRVEP